MKLTTIKSAKETGIPGIEFVFTDKSITEIILGKVRIRKGESYSTALQVLVETPFETAERYKLVGKIDGFPDAVSYHDDKYSADTASAALEDKGATTTVEKLTVQIDDNGNVIDGASATDSTSAAVPAMADSDLPF